MPPISTTPEPTQTKGIGQPYLSGLTLLEITGAALIAALLTLVALQAVEQVAERGREAALRRTLMELQRAVDMFYAENNYYPTGSGSTIGLQPDGTVFGVELSWTAQDLHGISFAPGYLRQPPSSAPQLYGLSPDDGPLYFGVTRTGLVFATQVAPGPKRQNP